MVEVLPTGHVFKKNLLFAKGFTMSIFHISIRSVFAAVILCFMGFSDVVAQDAAGSEEIAIAQTDNLGTVITDTADFAQSLYEPNISVANFAEVYEYKDYVSVFPNLAVDCINITIKESPFALNVATIKAEIRDLSGQLTYYSTFAGDRYKMDLHLLTPGLYILRLTSEYGDLIGSYEVKKFK